MAARRNFLNKTVNPKTPGIVLVPAPQRTLLNPNGYEPYLDRKQVIQKNSTTFSDPGT